MGSCKGSHSGMSTEYGIRTVKQLEKLSVDHKIYVDYKRFKFKELI